MLELASTALQPANQPSARLFPLRAYQACGLEGSAVCRRVLSKLHATLSCCTPALTSWRPLVARSRLLRLAASRHVTDVEDRGHMS